MVVDERYTHRVGAGKLTGLKRSGNFDGEAREWFEFRGVPFVPRLERFQYPVYLDPFQWGDVLDATGTDFLSLDVLFDSNSQTLF